MPLFVNDFQYELPDNRIALHPLKERDQSKLLVFKNGKITHQRFVDVASFLPNNGFLFFNDTKVIPARLLFTKETGAVIEIFLLSPVLPSTDVSQAMTTTAATTWKCIIGNVKRWPKGQLLEKKLAGGTLWAALADKENGLVHFSWTNNLSFAEVVKESGLIPLPPYLKRDVETADKERYQTIYSHYEGAVAAPTAGLHFTERVFETLQKRQIGHDFVTLHVSAGTFQPIKTDDVDQHVMHHEQIVITRQNIENLLRQDKKIVVVGTTSMRTLESLYWFGAKLLANPNASFSIGQNDPYDHSTSTPSRHESLLRIKSWFDENKTDKLTGVTSIFIKPGYRFRICEGLITNFHQPGSTLMLLVAAFIGDVWRDVYKQALDNDYRFLSYGDSSLLLPENN